MQFLDRHQPRFEFVFKLQDFFSGCRNLELQNRSVPEDSKPRRKNSTQSQNRFRSQPVRTNWKSHACILTLDQLVYLTGFSGSSREESNYSRAAELPEQKNYTVYIFLLPIILFFFLLPARVVYSRWSQLLREHLGFATIITIDLSVLPANVPFQWVERCECDQHHHSDGKVRL